MRGEDLVTAIAALVGYGSPPHARGRPRPRFRTGGRCRITPACAGKTRRNPYRLRRLWDHPRMRGEDWAHEHHEAPWTGSPPHARGRRF